jgi:hypothetical protein
MELPASVIKAGALLIENGTLLPKLLRLDSNAYASDWRTVNVRAVFEKDIQLADWTFFFMAGSFQATAFGFDKEKSVHTAVERLIVGARLQQCNCLEITEVAMKSFLGLPYACVSAHSRHVQASSVFSN